jgi:hypothetical protein
MPRSDLDGAAARDAGKRVGVYFLVGETEDEAGTLVAYVGEAENCYERLDGHHRRKDFWSTAITVTSKTQSFTKAHARYLEYDCLRTARDASRFRLYNDQTPTGPYISGNFLKSARGRSPSKCRREI